MMDEEQIEWAIAPSHREERIDGRIQRVGYDIYRIISALHKGKAAAFELRYVGWMREKHMLEEWVNEH